MLKVTSTIVFVGLRTFTTGGGMHGLFKSICRSGANPEKTLHIRGGALQVYHQTSELCSPVFKEAQPRPSEHSKLEYHTNNLNLYLHVF